MKGFLLIDGKYNTLHLTSKEFRDLLELLNHSNLLPVSEIKRHRTRADLNAEISDYLKMKGYYSNES